MNAVVNDLSIGTSKDVVFPEWPAGVLGDVASATRLALISEMVVHEDVLAERLSLISKENSVRGDLERVLCFFSGGKRKESLSLLSSLFDSSRDFALLSVQDIPELPDPLQIPQQVRAALRGGLRQHIKQSLLSNQSRKV